MDRHIFKGFWGKLDKPIIGMGPIDGVTDVAMRFMTAKYGKPMVMFTEFVTAEGMAMIDKGRVRRPQAILKALKYDETERPIVAQIFGKDPESFYVAAKKIVNLGFDGVDINMGCPSKAVTDNGAGAGLIENRALAKEIIAAVKQAVKDITPKPPLKLRGGKGEIPVSVKTRIGTNGPDPSWWEFLAAQDLAVVTMHGRTFKQLYQGLADWEVLAEAAKIIKQKGTLFLGNGDQNSYQQAVDSCQKYGTDGVLIGRAAEGNPWIFNRTRELKESKTQEKLTVAIEHARKYEELFPGESFLPMRKHLAWYARGFDGAAELRQKLVLSNSAAEAEKIIFP